MTNDEEHIAALLRELPPAPKSWTTAAKELPRARRALEAIERDVLQGAPARALETAELERALEAAGFPPTAELVDTVARMRRHQR